MTDELTEFILDLLPTDGYLGVDVIVQDWNNRVMKKARERLDEFVNGLELPCPGCLTVNFSAAGLDEITEIKVRERLDQLKEDGRIECSPDGVRWQLTGGYPVTDEVVRDEY